MARFKPPPLARPPVDGQMRGEYGDSVPGTTGLDAGSYHARLWFGSSKGTPYSYEVYAVRGHIQVWASGEMLVKAKPLSNTTGAKDAVEGLKRFMGREGLSAFRAAAEKSGAKFVHLRTEHHVAKTSKPSLRSNLWTAAHRIAATCLHGIEETPDGIEPMESWISAGPEWRAWWETLSPWARATIAHTCEHRIRELLDDPAIHVTAWIKHFTTCDWRGRDFGRSVRPIGGVIRPTRDSSKEPRSARRSCFDVLFSQWIDPESALVRLAEETFATASRNLVARGEPPWPWNQPRKAPPPGPLFERARDLQPND